MYELVDGKLVEQLLEFASKEGVSVHHICCKTGSDHRTIMKYMKLIMRVQNSPRVKLETIGLHVLWRRENGKTPNTADR